jgi:DNA-binding MurR/RpiR family transcriptional regulator
MARSKTQNSEAIEHYGDIPLESNVESICRSVFHQNIESISDTLKVIDTAAINEASEKIIKARKVDIYGMGASSVVANYARLRFYRLGIISNVYSDSHLSIISSSLLKKEDVAIGVSNSGQSRDVVEALKLARKNKATTICITNCDNSPIVKESDIVLFTASKDSQVLNESLCARVAEITLLDALYASIISKKKEKLIHNLDITTEAIKSLRISGNK